MKALLGLLSHLTQRDMADFSSTQNGEAGGVDIAKVNLLLLCHRACCALCKAVFASPGRHHCSLQEEPSMLSCPVLSRARFVDRMDLIACCQKRTLLA